MTRPEEEDNNGLNNGERHIHDRGDATLDSGPLPLDRRDDARNRRCNKIRRYNPLPPTFSRNHKAKSMIDCELIDGNPRRQVKRHIFPDTSF